MAVTPSDFKTRFPEFGPIPNDRVRIHIDEAARNVSVAAWGQKADDGVLYLTAHLLAVFENDKTATGSGPVTQKKAGEVSASFGFSGEMLESDYSSTKYGRRFKSLLSTIFAARCL